VIQNSVDGRSLDVESTLAQFEAAIFSPDPANRRVHSFSRISPDISDKATLSS